MSAGVDHLIRKHSCTKQFDAGVTIHGPIQRLEPVDLSFRLIVASGFADRVTDRRNPLSQGDGKLAHTVNFDSSVS